ncbi:MAG: Glu-tRNA(Gln) amidotransferase subunit GatE [Planctomycetes bacterium]|nr:Glu-tRNA(Gln) amidotransferase subunit GatE [Planctomycetota bacterium]
MTTFKPFEAMTAEDYAAIGLRCGLEVHRQLHTPTKLFCRCPAGRYSDAYDAELLRHMRPTLSELGEYDGTALMEKRTKKHIHYRIHRDTVCTYEFDDTPPFLLCDEALDIALEIALLLRLNLVDELHISRKQYLDGSIPTGFQRTTILGTNGWIPYRGRRIGITQLGLEEDSCREVSDIGHDRVLLTDRLGTPLVEVVTDPDLRTPQELAEVGQIIRRLCVSTGKVRTGYGAARQDVNVSVRGGTRIEIKGVPQLWRIPRLVYNEARRQCALLRIRDELHRRSISADSLQHTAADVTGIMARTPFEPIRAALAAGERVACVALRGFAGLLNEPTQEHTLFAKEFSDRIRVVACLTRLPNMIHSDAATDALVGRDWQRLFRQLRAGDRDALILTWGPEEDTRTACEEIVLRAREATLGVPGDTRQALRDGTNGFERVLPGPQRMYPDTDLPPIAVRPERVARIRAGLPEYVWEQEERLRRLGLSEAAAVAVCQAGRAALLTCIVERLGVAAGTVATVLTEYLTSLRRARLEPQRLTDEELFAVFAAQVGGRLTRAGVRRAIRQLLPGGDDADATRPPVDEVFAAIGGPPPRTDELERAVADAVQASRSRRFSCLEARQRYLMGEVMRRWRTRAEGAAVWRLVCATVAAEAAKPGEPIAQRANV